MGYRYYRYCPSSNGRETRNNNLIFVESRASRVPIAAQLKSHRTGKKESEMSLNYTDNKEEKQGDPPRSTLNSSDKFFRAVVLRSNGIFVRTKIVSTKKKKEGKCERFEKKKIRTWKISDIAEIYIFHDETARGKKSIYRREAPLSGKKFHPKVFIGVGRPMDHFPVLENEKWRVARTESGPRGLPLSRLRRDNPRWSLSIPLFPSLLPVNLITEKFLAPLPFRTQLLRPRSKMLLAMDSRVASKFIVPCQSPGRTRVAGIESLDIYIYIDILRGI